MARINIFFSNSKEPVQSPSGILTSSVLVPGMRLEKARSENSDLGRPCLFNFGIRCPSRIEISSWTWRLAHSESLYDGCILMVLFTW